MEIHYCETCGLRVDVGDLDSGSALRHEAHVFCRKCVASGEASRKLGKPLSTARNKSISHVPLSPAAPAKPVVHERISARAEAPKKPSGVQPVVAGSAAFVVAMVVVFLVIGRSSPSDTASKPAGAPGPETRPTPPPTPISPVPEHTPQPAPVAVQPPVTSPAQENIREQTGAMRLKEANDFRASKPEDSAGYAALLAKVVETYSGTAAGTEAARLLAEIQPAKPPEPTPPQPVPAPTPEPPVQPAPPDKPTPEQVTAAQAAKLQADLDALIDTAYALAQKGGARAALVKLTDAQADPQFASAVKALAAVAELIRGYEQTRKAAFAGVATLTDNRRWTFRTLTGPPVEVGKGTPRVVVGVNDTSISIEQRADGVSAGSKLDLEQLTPEAVYDLAALANDKTPACALRLAFAALMALQPGSSMTLAKMRAHLQLAAGDEALAPLAAQVTQRLALIELEAAAEKAFQKFGELLKAHKYEEAKKLLDGFAGEFGRTRAAVRIQPLLEEQRPELELQIAMQSGGFKSVFLQDAGEDGLVVMEAENFQAKADTQDQGWQPVTRAGSSGVGAVAALPDINKNYTDDLTTAPRMDYKVHFRKKGKHYLWVRSIGRGGQADSCHAGLNGVSPPSARAISAFSSNWLWAGSCMNSHRAVVEVPSTGLHTVNIWVREDGFIIDRLLLTGNANYKPADAGPPESAQRKADQPVRR